jgi:membrane-associated phospholipid phosphatase
MVPFARVYRGMHHTTDVLAGLALGAAALGVGCLVARTWVAATERRHGRGEPAEPVEVTGAHLAGAGR